MTFLADVKAEFEPFEHLAHPHLCFGCGEQLTGAAVRYDGYAEKGLLKSLYLHPGCAALAGQRLIADGFPHRPR